MDQLRFRRYKWIKWDLGVTSGSNQIPEKKSERKRGSISVVQTKLDRYKWNVR